MTAIPLSIVKHLNIIELVNLTRVCLNTAIDKNCLEHVLADFVEELDEEKLPLIKTQLDRVQGLTGAIIRKRIDWKTWPTGPVDRNEVLKVVEEHGGKFKVDGSCVLCGQDVTAHDKFGVCPNA